jgi:hypothetical protein
MNTPFLDPAEIHRNCAEAALSAAATQVLLDIAARITNEPALLAIATQAHHALFELRAEDDAPIFRQTDAALGDEAGRFRALLVLDSIRLIRERQAARGVPAAISHAVMAHHPIGTLQDVIERTGRVDLGSWIWSWYGVVGSGDLHQLGRLEFFHKACDYPWRAYTHDATGETVVMLDAGVPLTEEGFTADNLTWESQWHETDATITGNAVSPLGFAVRAPATLAKDHWRLALGPGDIVLDLHIPGDTPLTLDSIRDAWERSEAFFDHYYPGNPFKAWVCDSWLFSPQIQHMLPAESNIVRWQNEGYLIPNDSGPDDFLNFTFGTTAIDPATAPRNTRLRRSVLEHLERGQEPLRSGNYLYLRRDLPRFGTQPYQVSSARTIALLTQAA